MTAHPDRDPALDRHLATVEPPRRRRDAGTLVDLIEDVTGEPARLFGSIVGSGRYDYRYESGRTGSGPAVAFAPRKAATVVYLPDGIAAHADALSGLGPHTTGVGCLYLKDLEAIDLDVLRGILERSHATVTAGTFGNRASEGGQAG